MLPTPQYAWPLLGRRAGREVWVKHENHTPTGAFKVRGGLHLLARDQGDGRHLAASSAPPAATTGRASRTPRARYGTRCVIVVPLGNSPEKNAAMRAFGAELIEMAEISTGARPRAGAGHSTRAEHMVPSFHRDLVAGVASYALELFDAVSKLDARGGADRHGARAPAA